ncbi:MAG: phage terminase small subunit [Moraxellaceae bacterium]|nr:phage terminase small subunit [Moraxellaceae bacterium]
MTTPARLHFERKLAASATRHDGTQPDTNRAHANQYELMLATLDEHRRRLKAVQSTERKIEVKRGLVPEYAAWCRGVMEGDAGVQDDVFMTVLLWQIDVGDFDAALPMAEYALRHGLVMPDRFERTTACLVAEEIADTALKAPAAALAAYLPALQQAQLITAEHDMPDEVRAKLHKAIAYALLAAPEDQQTLDTKNAAMTALQSAVRLHDKVGVKKDIERLERDIKNTAAGDPPAA